MAKMLKWDQLPAAHAKCLTLNVGDFRNEDQQNSSEGAFILCFVPTRKMHTRIGTLVENFDIDGFDKDYYIKNVGFSRSKPTGWWRKTDTAIIVPWTIPFDRFVNEIGNLVRLQPIMQAFSAPVTDAKATWYGPNGLPDTERGEIQLGEGTDLNVASAFKSGMCGRSESQVQVKPGQKKRSAPISLLLDNVPSKVCFGRLLYSLCKRQATTLKTQPALTPGGEEINLFFGILAGQESIWDYSASRLRSQKAREGRKILSMENERKTAEGKQKQRTFSTQKRTLKYPKKANRNKPKPRKKKARSVEQVYEEFLGKSQASLSFNVHAGGLIPLVVNQFEEQKLRTCFKNLFDRVENTCCKNSSCAFKSVRDIQVLGAFHIIRPRRAYRQQCGRQVAVFSSCWSIGRQIQCVTRLASTVTPEEIQKYIALRESLEIQCEVTCPIIKFNLPLLVHNLFPPQAEFRHRGLLGAKVQTLAEQNVHKLISMTTMGVPA